MSNSTPYHPMLDETPHSKQLRDFMRPVITQHPQSAYHQRNWFLNPQLSTPRQRNEVAIGLMLQRRGLAHPYPPYPVDLVYFFGGCYSQWHQSDMEIDGAYTTVPFDEKIVFKNAEQYMMYCKAKYFHDDEQALRILRTANPKSIKAYGRLVTPYDDAMWAKVRYDVVLEATFSKFTQNPELLAGLMEHTPNCLFVETSPYDGIWGIKLPLGGHGFDNPLMWRGDNLLGYAISEVYDYIKASKLHGLG